MYFLQMRHGQLSGFHNLILCRKVSNDANSLISSDHIFSFHLILVKSSLTLRMVLCHQRSLLRYRHQGTGKGQIYIYIYIK